MQQIPTKHNRFKDAPWYDSLNKYDPILVGGAGGIGSWTTLLLSRAGFSPIVFDFDTIEEHNLGGQLYGHKSIGKKKVAALQSVVTDFSGEYIQAFDQEVTATTMSGKYVITAFDNMEARKAMFERWTNQSQEDLANGLFIDGRLNAEQMWIYCVRPNKLDIETYRSQLFDSSEIPDAPCTFKQTSHAAAMIASHIVGFLTNHITNIKEGDMDREVPFYWEYYIPFNLITNKQSSDYVLNVTGEDQEII